MTSNSNRVKLLIWLIMWIWVQFKSQMTRWCRDKTREEHCAISNLCQSKRKEWWKRKLLASLILSSLRRPTLKIWLPCKTHKSFKKGQKKTWVRQVSAKKLLPSRKLLKWDQPSSPNSTLPQSAPSSSRNPTQVFQRNARLPLCTASSEACSMLTLPTLFSKFTTTNKGTTAKSTNNLNLSKIANKIGVSRFSRSDEPNPFKHPSSFRKKQKKKADLKRGQQAQCRWTTQKWAKITSQSRRKCICQRRPICETLWIFKGAKIKIWITYPPLQQLPTNQTNSLNLILTAQIRTFPAQRQAQLLNMLTNSDLRGLKLQTRSEVWDIATKCAFRQQVQGVPQPRRCLSTRQRIQIKILMSKPWWKLPWLPD